MALLNTFLPQFSCRVAAGQEEPGSLGHEDSHLLLSWQGRARPAPPACSPTGMPSCCTLPWHFPGIICCPCSWWVNAGAAGRAVRPRAVPSAARLPTGLGSNVLAVSPPLPLPKAGGTVFQHSSINKLAAVRGQRTSRLGAVGLILTCVRSLFLLLHRRRHDLRCPSSSASLSAVTSPLLLPRILSQSPDMLLTYCQRLSLSQTSPIFSYQPQSRIPERLTSGCWICPGWEEVV